MTSERLNERPVPDRRRLRLYNEHGEPIFSVVIPGEEDFDMNFTVLWGPLTLGRVSLHKLDERGKAEGEP